MSNNISAIGSPTINIQSPELIDVTVQPDVEVVPDTSHYVTSKKKEYSIVGDGLYASVNTDEPPQWLSAVVDSVVSTALGKSLSNLDDLRSSIYSALDGIEVARNVYEETVNIHATIDAVITSRLATLNASLAETQASLIDLQLTTVTADEAATVATQRIDASIADGAIKSQIDTLQVAVTNSNEAIAATYDTLSTMLEGIGDAVTEVRNEIIANDTGIQTLFAYNATIQVDNKYYRSGFGLNTSVTSGGTGTEADPYTSEFWINAARLKFTNDMKSGSVSPFTIDASGSNPKIHMSGDVLIDGTVSADKLNVNDVFSQNITFTGTIIGGDSVGGGIIRSHNNNMIINLTEGSIYIG